jgi:erythronate-4-phosphate dehydrogenase
MSIRIMADRHLQNLKQLLPDSADVTFFEPDNTLPADAAEFDALLVRTVSKINPDTLPETGKLSFIGTATAGFDHVDTGYLSEKGVTFARSEGCNARSVGEYVVTCLLYWADQTKLKLTSKKAGIVGCGHTGTFVAHFLDRLGVETVQYDPPKEKTEPGFRSASLEELLGCDILTFHTPLTKIGLHPTFHMADRSWFSHGFDLVINTARGGVVSELDLLKSKQTGDLQQFILDVWEGEPAFDDRAVSEAFIATPHIAGYSAEAKFRASQIVIEKLCRHFRIPVQETQGAKPYTADDYRYSPVWPQSRVLWENNRIRYYDRELRKLISSPDEIRSKAFAQLRTRMPLRHEYPAILDQLPANSPGAAHFQIFSGEPGPPTKRSTSA